MSLEDSTLPKDPNPKFQPVDDAIPENKPHFSTLAYVATALLVCIVVFVAVIGIWLYRRRRAARRLEHLDKHPPPPLLQHHVPIGHPLYTPMRSGLMTPLNEENSEDTSGPVGDEPAGAPVGRAAMAHHQGRSTNYGLVPSTSTGSFSGSMEPPSPSMNSVSHNSVSTPASAFAMSMSGRGGGVEMSAIPEDAPLNRLGPSSSSHSISINEDSVRMPPRQSLVMGR